MGNLVKVVIYNNTKKDYAFEAPETTIGEVLTKAGWDPNGNYMLAGEQLVRADFSRTLADFGYTGGAGTNTAHISAVAPKANA